MIEMCRLENVVIFIETIFTILLSIAFVLSSRIYFWVT